MRILIAGIIGSGKTTQSEILSKRMSLCLVNAGEMLREKAQEKTPEGSELRSELLSGNLVDNTETANLVKEKLCGDECRKGFILDGYPRSLAQLEVYDPEIDKVIYLDLPENQVTERLLKRGREDDTPEIIRERLRVFREDTEPVIKHYSDLGKLVRVDASGSESDVSSKVWEKING